MRIESLKMVGVNPKVTKAVMEYGKYSTGDTILDTAIEERNPSIDGYLEDVYINTSTLANNETVVNLDFMYTESELNNDDELRKKYIEGFNDGATSILNDTIKSLENFSRDHSVIPLDIIIELLNNRKSWYKNN